MPAIHVIANDKLSLLEAAQSAGFYLPAVCGGRGDCGKCAVKVISGSLPVSVADKARFSQRELEDGWRLACTAFPTEDVDVQIPETAEGQFSAVNSFEPPQTTNHKLSTTNHQLQTSSLGIAIDIGTTTLGFALADLRTGKIAARGAAVNKQRKWGADVISRIQKANSGGLSLLSWSVREQIAEGIAGLCAEAGTEPAGISRIVIAGNTVMLHLFLHLSCDGLGRTPFTPVTLDTVVADYRGLFGGDISCEVVVLPGISAFVGADITAGIFFTELDAGDYPSVLMDIGTNGEIAVAYGGKILCTATAAGPAFEGGNILWGTGSVPGAISGVRFQNGAFEIDTIGNKPPVGICGSGVVDAVYQALKRDMILPSGRFAAGVPENGIFLAKSPDGRDIVLCQKDVRELQLAKSAMRSGLDALLNHAGLGYNDIKTLYIAGGFGFNLNMESAAGIGLIPAPLVPKVSPVGNSALGGAVKYLLNRAASGGSGEPLRRIIDKAEGFNLGGDEYFSENFINNINFA